MEYIPGKYKKVDLEKAATFESDSIGLQVTLLRKEEKLNPNSGFHEHIAGTGLIVKFKGGKRSIHNKALLALMMGSVAYQTHLFRIDGEDLTGFWREQGLLDVEVVQVIRQKNVSHPEFKDIDLKKVKKEKEPVEPVMKV